VLRAAADLARKGDAKLVLFRAVGLPKDLPLEAYAMSPDDVIGALKERASRELGELGRALRSGTAYEARVEVGVPWQAICDAAKEVSASLVILGSHGYSGLDRLIGTTAAKVVNHADRSVLVVRPTEEVGEGTSR
jgi:nucleotide-binding universal stress UspA family protein